MVWKSGELELVKCDLCGSGKTRLLFTRPDGLDAVRCTSCGLAYLNPRPKPNVMHRLYERMCFGRRGFDWGYQYYIDELNRQSRLALARQELDDILLHVDVAGRSCLVTGSATGETCKILAEAGAAVTGIDVCKAAVTAAAEHFEAIDFRHCVIEALAEDDRFDLIFALDVLEHTGSPRSFMRHAAKHLKTGGRLVLTTPNYLCGRQGASQRRQADWCRSLEHLFFFTTDVLERYLVEQGLTVTEWCMRGGYVSLPEPAQDGKVKKMSDTLRTLVDYVRKKDQQPECQEVLPKMSRQSILMLAQKQE